MQAAARSIGQPVRILEAGSEAQFEAMFATAAQERIGALVVQNDPLFTDRRARLTALAARYLLPTIYELREFVTAGGLVTYGASQPDIYHQVAGYIARILRGAKPADLPVMQAARFELIIVRRCRPSIVVMKLLPVCPASEYS